jgi:hypothetical protein
VVLQFTTKHRSLVKCEQASVRIANLRTKTGKPFFKGFVNLLLAGLQFAIRKFVDLTVTCSRTTNAQMKSLEKAVRDFIKANPSFAVDQSKTMLGVLY